MSCELRVLNVAENVPIANAITEHVGGRAAQIKNNSNSHVSEFPFTLQKMPCRMVVTAMHGSLNEYEFADDYKYWTAVPPESLLTAPVLKKVTGPNQEAAEQLRRESRQCDWLILWVSSDTAGEALCADIVDVCQQASGNRLKVLRACFAGLTHAHLHQACDNLSYLDSNVARAAQAISEMDFRSTTATKRCLTMNFSEKILRRQWSILSFDWVEACAMGFIARRSNWHKRFTPEPYWSISMEVVKDSQTCPFAWNRGRLFDQVAVLALYELVIQSAADARVQTVHENFITQDSPLPLNTVELTRLSTLELCVEPCRCMEIADKLYKQGLISYPRTRSTHYHAEFDAIGIVRSQAGSSFWGGVVQCLLSRNDFRSPLTASCGHDKHPPIHPLRCAEREEMDSESWWVYELIVRQRAPIHVFIIHESKTVNNGSPRPIVLFRNFVLKPTKHSKC